MGAARPQTPRERRTLHPGQSALRALRLRIGGDVPQRKQVDSGGGLGATRPKTHRERGTLHPGRSALRALRLRVVGDVQQPHKAHFEVGPR